MKVAGVRELKAHLSLYLREVQAGETVLVTDRGRVVAELRAPGAATHSLDPAEVRYRAAVARGFIRPPSASAAAGTRLWEGLAPLGLPRGTTDALLAAERAEKQR